MLCHEWGIPHSEYKGWDPDDQLKAMAYLEYKSSLCSKCGTNPEDWMGERGRPLEPPPYDVHSVRCYGCVALEEVRARVDDKSTAATMNHSLRKIPKRVAERLNRKWQMTSR